MFDYLCAVARAPCQLFQLCPCKFRPLAAFAPLPLCPSVGLWPPGSSATLRVSLYCGIRLLVGLPRAGSPLCGLRPSAGFAPLRVIPPLAGFADVRVSPMCGFRGFCPIAGSSSLQASPLAGSVALCGFGRVSPLCRRMPPRNRQVFLGPPAHLCGYIRQ